MKKFFGDAIIFAIVFALLGYGIGVLIEFLINGLAWSMDLFSGAIAFVGLVLGAILGVCFAGMNISRRIKKAPSKGKTATGQEFELHFDARFWTRQEILNDKFIINSTWHTLPALKKTGLVFRNELIGSKYEISMKDETHALIVGTTGTGKTKFLLEPAIRIYARSAEKPSLVIADPKGELYEAHAIALQKEGYDVRVYDLDNPYISSRWNPMEKPFLTYERAMNVAKEAKIYRNCTPEQAGKTRIPGHNYGDVWYEFDGVAFADEESLNRQINTKKQQLLTDTTAELKGIVSSICPVTPNSDDTIWEQGAQDFLYGIMLAMLEDSADKRLGDKKLRLDQFNFYNLYKIANTKDPNDPDNPFGPLRRYCMGRPVTSDVGAMTMPVVNSAPTTTKSYMSVLAGKINNLMTDMGICYATSACDIKFNEFVQRPTAFFIKIPDHKKERHPLATICIGQLYRSLVDIANTLPNKKLTRHVYFLLDEFGNLPVIPDFATMITVARSRNILFEIVLQSYAQLDTKYGKEAAETIKSNFNIQIFLGTEDPGTREAFSKSCGEIQLLTNEEQVTENKGKDGGGASISKSQQRHTRPLIDPYELSLLPFGTIIVKLFRQNPYKTKPLPIFKADFMTKFPAPVVSTLGNSLNEQVVFYDINRRNMIVSGRQLF